MEAYTRVAGQRYKPGGLFAEWGRQQYTLSVLAVLPGFRRKGVGTALVNWGVREVSGNGWPVTVCASPMGRYLYEHLGFVDIGTEVIRAEDEENSFSSKAMALQPESSGRVSGNVPTQSTKA
ncbi:hypothetical protein F5Y10DRAFT_246105 [Nemania abortiva]|nr:hypothetical protein F5Y10DRAFT_246105 [Nemania abortiva]